MSVKIISLGMSKVEAMSLPLPVNIIGGEVAIIQDVEVETVWSGPYGYMPDNERQVTTTDPGAEYDYASHEKPSGGYYNRTEYLETQLDITTEDGLVRFNKEFPTARPGFLYGMVYVSWGYAYGNIDDCWSPDTTKTTIHRTLSGRSWDNQSCVSEDTYLYSSGYLSLGKIFEPKVSTGGMWVISFPKPIPFKIGLRYSYDNGSASCYFLYALDPAFA